MARAETDPDAPTQGIETMEQIMKQSSLLKVVSEKLDIHMQNVTLATP